MRSILQSVQRRMIRWWYRTGNDA